MSISDIKTITIESGQTDSNAVEVHGYDLFAIEFPAAMTGSAVKFKGLSGDGSTYNLIADEGGSDISISFAASNIVGLDAASMELSTLRVIKVVSGSAEASDRTLYLHCKG